MGERLPCTEEVRGSSPLISIIRGCELPLDFLTRLCESDILFFAHEKARSMIEISKSLNK